MNAWERGALYATDSKGKRIRPPEHLVLREDGWHVVELILCRGTPTYVSVIPEGDFQEDERRRRYRDRLELLTPGEHEVLRLQGKIVEHKEVTHEIASGNLVHYQRQGYTLVPKSARIREREGLPPIEIVQVVGLEPIPLHLSQERIAEEIGITVDAVRKRIERAQRKLKEGR